MISRIYSFLLIVLGLNINPTHSQSNEQFAFVTKLGIDTVAVESISIAENMIEVKALVRSPKLSQRTYKMGLAEDGRLISYEYLSLDKDGKELDSKTNYAVDTSSVLLPFHDYIHWSLDQAIRQVKDEPIEQAMQAGRRALDFVFEPNDENIVTIVHPFRGTMAVQTDDKGRLQHLDAANTTRKLTVERVPSLEMDKLFARFSALEAAGKAFGELSGRGSFVYPDADNPQIRIDFGQPRKRGRQIFGKIVPYGKRWRTGANRATHFTTEKDITIGDLAVPAGKYTFFTVLNEDGGVLFINKQTGQNGRQYDESKNLGQVKLSRSAIEGAPIEDFTIDISNGLLRLRWDDTSWEVNIKH